MSIFDECRVNSIRIRGRSATIGFGVTRKPRDLSGGALPVKIVRVSVGADGNQREEWRHTCQKRTTIARAVREAGRGWCPGDTDGWVEIRAIEVAP